MHQVQITLIVAQHECGLIDNIHHDQNYCQSALFSCMAGSSMLNLHQRPLAQDLLRRTYEQLLLSEGM
jgi:hypothetical protein